MKRLVGVVVLAVAALCALAAGCHPPYDNVLRAPDLGRLTTLKMQLERPSR